MFLGRRVMGPTNPLRTCGPCRRAVRRGRTAHTCYGAVVDVDNCQSTTWVACPCRCRAEVDGSLDVPLPADDTVARVLAAAPVPERKQAPAATPLSPRAEVAVRRRRDRA